MRTNTTEIIDEMLRQEMDKLERNIQSANEFNPVKLSNRLDEYWPFIKENAERIEILSEIKNYFVFE